jgi:hypothetical protein
MSYGKKNGDWVRSASGHNCGGARRVAGVERSEPPERTVLLQDLGARFGSTPATRRIREG